MSLMGANKVQLYLVKKADPGINIQPVPDKSASAFERSGVERKDAFSPSPATDGREDCAKQCILLQEQ